MLRRIAIAGMAGVLCLGSAFWISSAQMSQKLDETRPRAEARLSELPRGVAEAFLVVLHSDRQDRELGWALVRKLLADEDTRMGRRGQLFWHLKGSWYTFVVTAFWSREEILESYLNRAYFGQVAGQEIHGIARAAGVYFGKQPQALSLSEGAALAVISLSPGYYSPFTSEKRLMERWRGLMQEMKETEARPPRFGS